MFSLRLFQSLFFACVLSACAAQVNGPPKPAGNFPTVELGFCFTSIHPDGKDLRVKGLQPLSPTCDSYAVKATTATKLLTTGCIKKLFSNTVNISTVVSGLSSLQLQLSPEGKASALFFNDTKCAPDTLTLQTTQEFKEYVGRDYFLNDESNACTYVSPNDTSHTFYQTPAINIRVPPHEIQLSYFMRFSIAEDESGNQSTCPTSADVYSVRARIEEQEQNSNVAETPTQTLTPTPTSTAENTSQPTRKEPPFPPPDLLVGVEGNGSQAADAVCGSSVITNGNFESFSANQSSGNRISLDTLPGWGSPNNSFVLLKENESIVPIEGGAVLELQTRDIWQDVNVTPEQVLTVGFFHRGLDGADVMDILIGPVGSQTRVGTVSTGPQWMRYRVSYAVPAYTDKVRLTFKGRDTFSGEGNLVDGVGFDSCGISRTSQSTATDTASSSSGLSSSAVAGLVAGLCVLALVVGLGGFLLARKRYRSKKDTENGVDKPNNSGNLHQQNIEMVPMSSCRHAAPPRPAPYGSSASGSRDDYAPSAPIPSEIALIAEPPLPSVPLYDDYEHEDPPQPAFLDANNTDSGGFDPHAPDHQTASAPYVPPVIPHVLTKESPPEYTSIFGDGASSSGQSDLLAPSAPSMDVIEGRYARNADGIPGMQNGPSGSNSHLTDLTPSVDDAFPEKGDER